MALRWDSEGRDWPHRENSRFVEAGGLRWHVQRFEAADRPLALLLHGTGASTHSWRGVAPALHAAGFEVLSLDLPGHGFTTPQDGAPASRHASMAGMARAVAALLDALRARPALVAGHSAGAALALRMSLDGLAAPRMVASINGALLPWSGIPGRLFAPVARLLAATPVAPTLFAWRASDPQVLERLIGGTGSTLDAQGLALYQRLVQDPGHAAGALSMMAHWDLPGLERRLPQLAVPLACMVGSRDLTVPPSQSREALLRVPQAMRLPLVTWPGLGHLAHEEQPALAAGAIVQAWEQAGGAAGG